MKNTRVSRSTQLFAGHLHPAGLDQSHHTRPPRPDRWRALLLGQTAWSIQKESRHGLLARNADWTARKRRWRLSTSPRPPVHEAGKEGLQVLRVHLRGLFDDAVVVVAWRTGRAAVGLTVLEKGVSS